MSISIAKLQQLQADAIVMFSKLHNYHWNVKGSNFFALHAKTQSSYEMFAEMYDDLAERILQLGQKPVLTLKDALLKTQIKEESADRFTGEAVLQALLTDYQYFLVQFRELCHMQDGDMTTQAYAQEKVAYFEKEIWMLEASLGR